MKSNNRTWDRRCRKNCGSTTTRSRWRSSNSSNGTARREGNQSTNPIWSRLGISNYCFFFSLFYEPKDFYLNCKDLAASENGGVAVAEGWSIKRIDALNRKAYLDDDTEITYEKCLIATGKWRCCPLAVVASTKLIKHFLTQVVLVFLTVKLEKCLNLIGITEITVKKRRICFAWQFLSFYDSIVFLGRCNSEEFERVRRGAPKHNWQDHHLSEHRELYGIERVGVEGEGCCHRGRRLSWQRTGLCIGQERWIIFSTSILWFIKYLLPEL